ncbi:phosphoribosylamine--glycine ligase [Coxiella endosymbiont of Amblyomma americanum]|uniref:phosphoribosylamine--glycine ligase n=1 Tax=Coxiella endosymbiont of Amblyomma americanum TaxID=325775 RepID=UPI00057FC59D|nr:phosphoribosylamine--glycine ligase [Coxiella endosymbiont of Amblyomma americanum]AJC50469.1 phosphoribosylamine--glycine ligase [Coxiella endosymbiont of Amblyomma americanum]AUJ58809.1 phosphoribosylamine--glycine ligase [Coxiella-like endosymbiont of Amblyomma americanum]
MHVLIIGNGGREHALAWKVAQSARIKKIWVVPGNAGTAIENKVQNVSIDTADIHSLVNFAQKNKIDFTIVGPEVPLAYGIVDQFHKKRLSIFGPTQTAARLETSKNFCKEFLNRYNIPTADSISFTEKKNALLYLSNQSFPIVIKANGLAAGKGVFIAQSFIEAKNIVISMLEEKKLGVAGQEIVVEDFLYGEELSFTVIISGKHFLPLASSQDYKRLLCGNRGPNTGGMGAYSPVSRLSNTLQEKIITDIIRPTITGLETEGIGYKGFLYIGLMITPNGVPKVLEFNVRLGDPETQVLMMRLQSDLTELILSALSDNLNQINIIWDQRVALTVVMASKGYPGNYKKGDIIKGLRHIFLPTDIKIFHANTMKNNNLIVTNGGRVLSITALGFSVQEAQKKVYRIVSQISWPNCYYRDDIGL